MYVNYDVLVTWQPSKWTHQTYANEAELESERHNCPEVEHPSNNQNAGNVISFYGV